MTQRWRRGLAVATAIVGIAGAAPAASRHHPVESINPANAKLLALPPAAQSAELAKAVGHWCIGAEAFPMGIITAGRGQGNAYWSLRCADGSAWAVQIDPLGAYVAIGCAEFNAGGSSSGKECFKKF